jgi:spermidine/putrescine transport system ATP-binding protein
MVRDMLELKALRKSYGSVEAVKGVDLHIREGEFFSLLGPSGCGKTTILRMLGGFEKPSAGEIFLDGRRIDLLPAHQRQFNTVFQRYALFPHLSVFENVAFGLRMKGTKGSELQTRVAEALQLVQMADHEKRSVTTLSGGQQQRVALARALVNRPRVLLLDEPLSALDEKLRAEMKVELLSLQRKLKMTFIFVTHDQEEALTLSDRLAVMNQGLVEQVGSPQEIYEYPRSPFVANFIGTSNSIAGEVSQPTETAIHVMQAPRKNLVIRASRDGVRPLPIVQTGQKVKILIRPEKMKILKSHPGTDQNFIEGSISEILYRGPNTQFHVSPKDSLGNGTSVMSIVQANSAITAKKAFSIGEKVFVAWQAEDCVLMGEDGALPLPEAHPISPALVMETAAG